MTVSPALMVCILASSQSVNDSVPSIDGVYTASDQSVTVSPVLMVCILTSDQSVTVSPVLMVCILTSGQSVSDSVPSTDGVHIGFRPVSQ